MSSASTMQRPKTQDERDLVLYESRLQRPVRMKTPEFERNGRIRDRKSTRLNSSHSQISYAVFCLKKKTVPAVDRLLPGRLIRIAVERRSWCRLRERKSDERDEKKRRHHQQNTPDRVLEHCFEVET